MQPLKVCLRCELTATERAGMVARWLALGDCLTVAEVAELLSMTPNGAGRLLRRLSRVVPIYLDDDGLWKALVE